MIVRQLIAKYSIALALGLVATVAFAADAPPQKDSGPDFSAMIRELQQEIQKIKDEILKLRAELQGRQERAERRRALQKQEDQKLQDLEYQNSHKP